MQIRLTEKNPDTATKLRYDYDYLVGSHDQMSYFMVHGVTQSLSLD